PELRFNAFAEEFFVPARQPRAVPLRYRLPDSLLDKRGEGQMLFQVATAFPGRQKPKGDRRTVEVTYYGPGYVDWSQGVEQATAFITPDDEAVQAVVRPAIAATSHTPLTDFGSSNVMNAAALTDAASALHIRWEKDQV